MAKSGLTGFVDASERRFSALAAWRLPRWLGSHLAAARVCDCRTGWGWLKALLLRTRRDAHGTMPHSSWRGRAEERCGLEDGAIRLTAHSRLQEMDMLSCVPYVCMRSRDVLNSSIYLILSSSMDLGASGRLSRAFKTCQNLLSHRLGTTVHVGRGARAHALDSCRARLWLMRLGDTRLDRPSLAGSRLSRTDPAGPAFNYRDPYTQGTSPQAWGRGAWG